MIIYYANRNSIMIEKMKRKREREKREEKYAELKL